MRGRGWVIAACLMVAAEAGAGERYALIVAGAAGGADYGAQYGTWSAELSTALVERLQCDPALVTILSDSARAETRSTAANVRRAIDAVRGRMTAGDTLLVVLIGHGTFDGTDAKFNLVGPDLEAAEWSGLLRGLPGRVVVVNTTAASFPFLERLAAPGRVVITATDSPAQRYDTVFPGYFIGALADPAADLDKNGRVSIWEAFAAASGAVRRDYQQRGELATERALLDDNGDGIGSDLTTPGEDGSLASRTYLDAAPPGAAPTDEALLKLLQRKTLLEAEVADLRIRKGFLSAADYATEFERLMIELARVSHELRARTGVQPPASGR